MLLSYTIEETGYNETVIDKTTSVLITAGCDERQIADIERRGKTTAIWGIRWDVAGHADAVFDVAGAGEYRFPTYRVAKMHENDRAYPLRDVLGELSNYFVSAPTMCEFSYAIALAIVQGYCVIELMGDVPADSIVNAAYWLAIAKAESCGIVVDDGSNIGRHFNRGLYGYQWR